MGKLSTVTVQLNPGADRRQALANVADVAARLTRIHSTHDSSARYREYCSWAAESVRVLRSALTQRELESLILTKRYWALQSLNVVDHTTVNMLLALEVDERAAALQDAQRTLQGEIDRWDETTWRVVPDTGIFLRHKCKFDVLDWADLIGRPRDPITVVIPLAVVQQLDNNKREGHIGYRAGASIAILNRLFEGAGNPFQASPILQPADQSRETHEDNRIRPETTVQVLPDRPGDRRMPTVDEEIIAQALEVKILSGRRVYLATFDTHMAFRGREAGLEVVKLGPEELHEKAKPRPYTPEPNQE